MKHIPFFVASILVCALPACGPSKVQQCNSFVDEANKIVEATNKINYDDETSLKNASTAVENGAKKVKELNLKDEKLKEMQGRYVSLQDTFSASLKKGVTLIADEKKAEAGDDKKLVEKLLKDSKAFQDELKKLDDDEEKLVKDLNTYCTGTP